MEGYKYLTEVCKMQISFESIKLARRLKQDSVLMKIDRLVDWKQPRSGLGSLYKWINRAVADKNYLIPDDAQSNSAEPMASFVGYNAGEGVVCELILCISVPWQVLFLMKRACVVSVTTWLSGLTRTNYFPPGRSWQTNKRISKKC